MEYKTFRDDAQFLQEHTDAVVLKKEKSAIVVVPEYQGRVMTATAQGEEGASSGWINYNLIKQGVLSPEKAEGRLEEHMHAFGGEERFWMGPEGGQFALFFAPGKAFEFANWFTPVPIDNAPWKTAAQSTNEIIFEKEFDLQNHFGTKFRVGVKRAVRLLEKRPIEKLLGTPISEAVDFVAYRSIHTVFNRGKSAWVPKNGLISIWMLCMFRPSPATTVFIPYRQGTESDLGPIVNADYFGRVPPERLRIQEEVIYFKCDGRQRGKIGVSPERSLGIAGSYDPDARRVSLLLYEQPKEHIGYVNSTWEHQKEPYKGDALNSYNDGPADDSGGQMGPFYELESSSPALALNPGEAASHIQTIIHFYGEEERLQSILNTAGVPIYLEQVRKMFQHP